MGNTVNLNFSAVVDQSQPVDKGPYKVLIKQFKRTPETDAERQKRFKDEDKYPYWFVRGEITEGDFAGRSLFCNLTEDPRLAKNGQAKNFMLFDFLKVLGLVENPEEIEFDPTEVLNAEMVWIVDVTEAKGDPDDADYQPAGNVVKKFRPMP